MNQRFFASDIRVSMKKYEIFLLLIIATSCCLSKHDATHHVLTDISLRHRSAFALKGGSSVGKAEQIRSLSSSDYKTDDPSLHDIHHVEHVHDGDMPLRTAILNLITDLCAHGMLPLAFGIASNGGTGLITAVLMVAVFGFLSGYTIVSLGRASKETGLYNFSSVWGTLINPKTSWIIESSFAVMTFGCCIFYSAFMGDLFSSLSKTVSFIPSMLQKRWIILTILSIFPLLPLCLLKNLSALQYTSFGGMLSVLYTTFFVVKRSFDGTYSPGGKFYENIDEKFRSSVTDSWGSVGLWKVGSGTITLMNMACVAFMAHYNGIKYYEELKDRTVKKYSAAVASGMGCSFVIFSLMMLFGFKTFGNATQPLVLNNYHKTDDVMATIARLTTGLAIVCGYPIMFTALRTSSINAIKEIGSKFHSLQRFSSSLATDDALRTFWSISLLAVITAFACDKSEEDVAVVVGLIGALLGSGANFIIPAVLNLRLFKRMNIPERLVSEYTLNRFILIAGAIFMFIGTRSVLMDSAQHTGS